MVLGMHVAAGVLGALLAVWIFGRASYSWGLIRVGVSVAPAVRGETAIVLTPIGDVTARTHRTPIRLTVELERLNLPALRRAARELPDAQTVMADIERRALRSAANYALRMLALSLAGGILASLLLVRGPFPRHLASGFAGALVMALLFAATARTFDRKAFAGPRYNGPLAEAPGAIRFARDGLARLSRLRGRMDGIAANLARFYASLDEAGPRMPGENDIRVLHVSDIHNNPLAVDLVAQLARRFRADLVVNTGDLTDYGTEAEEAVLQPLRGLSMRQLFVAGNHDSRTTMRALSRIPDARVLDGQTAVIEGVRFLGFADPVSRRAGYGNVDPSAEDLDALEREIRRTVAGLSAPPDVLLVHNHRVAERLGGVAPVILYGHSHRASIRRIGGTVFINAGTTGAAGARYFQAPNGVPYSAVVLHFSREHRGHLLAADVLHMRGAEGEFTLQRHMLNGTVATPEEAAGP